MKKALAGAVKPIGETTVGVASGSLSQGSRKIRKVDVSNPLSTFRKQVRQKKKYLIPSKFAKEE